MLAAHPGPVWSPWFDCRCCAACLQQSSVVDEAEGRSTDWPPPAPARTSGTVFAAAGHSEAQRSYSPRASPDSMATHNRMIQARLGSWFSHKEISDLLTVMLFNNAVLAAEVLYVSLCMCVTDLVQ
jgi:hypothetical protein